MQQTLKLSVKKYYKTAKNNFNNSKHKLYKTMQKPLNEPFKQLQKHCKTLKQTLNKTIQNRAKQKP